MASYEIQSPDGNTYEVDAPDDATQEQVLSYFQSQVTQVSSPFAKTLKDGGVSKADQSRLLNTGVTPGTAAEYASAHIKAGKARGRTYNPREQEAIFDLYKRQAGRDDLSARDIFAEQKQRDLAERGDTLTGRIVDVASGAANSLAQKGLDVLGLVAPKAAEDLALDVNEQYATAPGSRAKAGSIVAEAAVLPAAMAAGPIGAAALFGTQGAGGQRRAVSQLRQQGQDVSGLSELATATGVGAAEALSGYASSRIFSSLGAVLKSSTPVFRNAVAQGEAGAVRSLVNQAIGVSGHALAEGGDEAITQVITNSIRKGIDPSQAILDGVGEAFVLGAILTPFGVLGEISPHGQSTESSAADSPGNLPESTPQAVPPRGVLEQRLTGQTAVAASQTIQESQFTKPAPVIPQPDHISDSGTKVVFSPTDPNAEQNAETYAESLRRTLPNDTVEVTQAPRRGGWEVNIIEGGKIANDVRSQIDDMSQTQKRKLVRKARQQDLPVSNIEDVRNLPLDQFSTLIGAAQQKPTDQQTDRRQATHAEEVPAGPIVERRTDRQGRRSPDLREQRAEIEQLFREGKATEAHKKINDLQETARRDPKGTGLLNGQTFSNQLTAVEDEVKRTKKPRHIAVMDVANLGISNTVQGHLTADAHLKRVADAVLEVAGPDASFRTGGDEMAVIFPPDTSKKRAKEMLQQIENKVGFSEVVPGASLFTAGEVGTIRPDTTSSSVIDKLDLASEAKKRRIKQKRGEPATFSKEQAELLKSQRMADPTLKKDFADPQANAVIQEVATEYTDSKGIAPPIAQPGTINPLTARKLASEYGRMKHAPNKADVKASYEAMKSETLDQFNQLKSKGYFFEFWTGDKQPYTGVDDMARDLAENRHLYVFPTAEGFGPKGKSAFAKHPLLEIAPGTTGWTHNDVFRAVHDVYGHAKDGFGFDIDGEENAWRSHVQMYSPDARGAVTTETRGQSTWVGFGPKGRANQKAIADNRTEDIVFAEQKAGLLPVEFWTPEGTFPAPATFSQKLKTTLSRGRASAVKATPVKGTSHKRIVPQAVEDLVTPTTSRIMDISPPIFDRLMTMEFNASTTRETLKRLLHGPTARIKSALRAAGKEQEFKLLVLNQKQEEAETLVSDIDPELVPDFQQFVLTYRNLLDSMRDAGVTVGDVPGYWPRFLKDFKNFKKEFGEDQGDFEEAWNLARRTLRRSVLSPAQKATIANSIIQGYGPKKPGSSGPSNARSRRIKEIPREALGHYLDPFEAAFRYVDGAAYAAERSRFLGRNHQPDDLGETVGVVIRDQVEAGNLTTDQQDELRDLLVTRFTADILVPSKTSRNFRQLIYLLTLGQFRSTLTQLTDIAITATDHGVLNAVGGLTDALRLTNKDRRIVMESLGIHDTGEEFKDVGAIARNLDRTLRTTGFKAIDRMGKESRINAASRAFSQAAISPHSARFARLRRQYRPVLGAAAFTETMKDFREGRQTERTRYLLFLDITKVQPVVTSQMPKRYLDMPNGRILYTLKTFTLTQMDHVRRSMIRKLRLPGQRREGLTQLARYITFVGLMGMGVDMMKDLLRGVVPQFEQLTDRAMESLLGLIGINRYMADQAVTSPGDAAVNYVAPPLSWMNALAQDAMSKQPLSETGIRSIKFIPVVGELLYYWAPFGRGSHLTRDEAKRDYRSKLRDLRERTVDASQSGDDGLARTLLRIYNERRKQGPGDGRKSPLTMADLARALRRAEDLQRKEGRKR